MAEILDIEKLKNELSKFAKCRDWEKFHSPKNLAMALMVESGELLEIFQWLTIDEANTLKFDDSEKEKVSHELADVLLYAIQLADRMDINLTKAITDKLKLNSEKYPVA